MKKSTKIKFVFYTLLILNIAMFLYSFVVENVILTVVCFVMAIMLSKFNKNVPMPKYFQKLAAQKDNKKEEDESII